MIITLYFFLLVIYIYTILKEIHIKNNKNKYKGGYIRIDNNKISNYNLKNGIELYLII